MTLLISHGNALDAGLLVPFARELAVMLNVNVLCYDYTGYGCSTGKPSIDDTYADIDAVVKYLVVGRAPSATGSHWSTDTVLTECV